MIYRLLSVFGLLISGEGGIRTHGTVTSTRTFQARSFGHSDTSPYFLNNFTFFQIYVSINRFVKKLPFVSVTSV
jgi:hypothetical protein